MPASRTPVARVYTRLLVPSRAPARARETRALRPELRLRRRTLSSEPRERRVAKRGARSCGGCCSCTTSDHTEQQCRCCLSSITSESEILISVPTSTISSMVLATGSHWREDSPFLSTRSRAGAGWSMPSASDTPNHQPSAQRLHFDGFSSTVWGRSNLSISRARPRQVRGSRSRGSASPCECARRPSRGRAP